CRFFDKADTIVFARRRKHNQRRRICDHVKEGIWSQIHTAVARSRSNPTNGTRCDDRFQRVMWQSVSVTDFIKYHSIYKTLFSFMMNAHPDFETPSQVHSNLAVVDRVPI